MASPFELSSSEPSAGSSPRLFALPLNVAVQAPAISPHQKSISAHHTKSLRGSLSLLLSQSHPIPSQSQTHHQSQNHHHLHNGANPRSSALQSPFPSSSSSASTGGGTRTSSPHLAGIPVAAGSATMQRPSVPPPIVSAESTESSEGLSLTVADHQSTPASQSRSGSTRNPEEAHHHLSANSSSTNIHNQGLASLLHSPLHQPQPPLHLTQPLGVFPKQRLSSINSITSNHSFTMTSAAGANHQPNASNINSSSNSHHPRSMSIISLNSPRESLISADDLKNLPGTRNNSYTSLVSLLDSALRKQKTQAKDNNSNINNINGKRESASVSDDEEAGLRLNYNMVMSSLKPPMGHAKVQLPASMVFTEFKRLSSGSTSMQPSTSNTSNPGSNSNPPNIPMGMSYTSPNSHHLKMHDLTPSPLSLAENPFNDYNFAQAQSRHRHYAAGTRMDPMQAQQPVSDAESDISLVDHSGQIVDSDRDMILSPNMLLPSMSPTSSAISNVSMTSTNSTSSNSSAGNHLRTTSMSNDLHTAANPTKKIKSLRLILLVSKSKKNAVSGTPSSNQPNAPSQALLLKKKYIFSKDVQFELLQKKTSAVNEMITTKFVRLSSLPLSKVRGAVFGEAASEDKASRSRSFDDKSGSISGQWRQQQQLIRQLNRKWNKNELESSETAETKPNSRKRTRSHEDEDDDEEEDRNRN